MSRIGRTMYFHRRSLPIFKMCRSVSKKSQFVSNKNIRPWKVLEGFLFTHCKASKNPLRFCCSHSLVFFFFFFFFYALQLVKCVEFSWDNLCFINWVDKINWPPWRVETKKSSVQKLKKSFGKKFLNSLGWPIQIINSVDETEFSYCITDWRNTAVL